MLDKGIRQCQKRGRWRPKVNTDLQLPTFRDLGDVSVSTWMILDQPGSLDTSALASNVSMGD